MPFIHRDPTRFAFTLIELLVVIGIIAILIGILIPTLSRARDQSNRVTCASNLRQLALGMLMYANANHDYLPATAYSGIPRRNETNNTTGADWIWWDQRDYLDGSAIAPFIGKPNLALAVCDAALDPVRYPPALSTLSPNLFRCPSDDWTVRYRNLDKPCGPYRYSYVMSKFLGITHLSEPQWGAYWRERIAPKLTRVVQPSDKVLLYEQDSGTLNDGQGHPGIGNSTDNYDLLSVRHSRIKTVTPNTAGLTDATIPCPNELGNIAYCDGSVRATPRIDLTKPNIWLPRWPTATFP